MLLEREPTEGWEFEPGYRVGTELAATARLSGERESAGRLVQLSLEHMTLRLAALQSPRLGQPASVVVGAGERWVMALEAEVMQVRRREWEQGAELSLRFVSPPLSAAQRIVSLLETLREDGLLLTPESRPVWQEPIQRPERVVRICEAMAARRSRGLARVESGAAVEVFCAEYDRFDKRLGWEVPGGVLPAVPFTLEAFGYGSVLHMEVESLEWEGGLWYMPLPREVVRYRHRWLRRAPAQEGAAIHFQHPLWPQVQVSRRLLDLSYEGLSFFTEPAEDLLYPGMRVPCAQVTLPGRPPVSLEAEVRNVSRTPYGRRCGVAVLPLSPEHALAWRHLVEEQLHPSTRISGDWNAGTWELFDRSGYFRLSGKAPAEFDRLRAEFCQAQDKLEACPELGFRVVRPQPGREREAEATLSMLKPYAGTWMAHQLARHAPGAGRSALSSVRESLRDIHLRGYEPAQLDPSIHWLLAYCEAHVRWSRVVAFDFASWYEPSGRACLMPFRLTEGHVQRMPALPEGFTLGAPSPEELGLFFSRLEATRSRPYREALDLVPERWSLSATCQQWRQAQLSRERELLVARQGGRPLAVAVLETAHPGLNLFHVLDGVRLVALEDESLPEVQQALGALLSGAADWYRARGREVFVHYLETPHDDYAQRAELRDLGEGRIWILSSQLLPEFLEHLCECTVERPRRQSRAAQNL